MLLDHETYLNKLKSKTKLLSKILLLQINHIIKICKLKNHVLLFWNFLYYFPGNEITI